MRTVDYLKDLVFGFLTVLCLAMVPVEILTVRMTPALLEYLSPTFFAIIMVISLVVSVILAIFGVYLIYNTFPKYVKLVKSNQIHFANMYSNEARVMIFARKLHDKISIGKNSGYEQAKVLLKLVYTVCRNRLLGISNWKLKKILNMTQSVCPEIRNIEIQVEFHPEGTREYLCIKYFVGSSLKSVMIPMATLEYA